jgi:hypothetical protein
MFFYKFDSKQTVAVEESAMGEGTTSGDVTSESTYVTDLSGILSYYPNYQM